MRKAFSFLDAKIFYVDRSEDAKDAEAANAPAASAADMLDGGEKAAIGGSASPVAGAGAELGTQHSLMLRGKGGGASSSATAATSLQPLAPVPVGPPHVLPELGISISKVPRSGFQVRFEVQKRPTARVRSLLKVESVEKRDTSFIAGDRLTAMSLNLDQLKLADAAKLLELLVPYRIQLEVLRVNVETAAPPAAVDDAQAASAASPPLPSPPPPLPSSPPPSLVTDETTNDGGNELSNVATAEAVGENIFLIGFYCFHSRRFTRHKCCQPRPLPRHHRARRSTTRRRLCPLRRRRRSRPPPHRRL